MTNFKTKMAFSLDFEKYPPSHAKAVQFTSDSEQLKAVVLTLFCDNFTIPLGFLLECLHCVTIPFTEP